MKSLILYVNGGYFGHDANRFSLLYIPRECEGEVMVRGRADARNQDNQSL